MSAYLEELAVRFVERDGPLAEQKTIAANAADCLLNPSKYGYPSDSTVLILVKSIRRWVFSEDDEAISEFANRREKYAQGLEYLALTLMALPKAFLQSNQIRMLAGFFCSQYQQEDSAGVSAATDALLLLISTKNFPPSSADGILVSIGKLGPDNYTKQLSRTRLKILQIIKTLVLNDRCARVLQKRHEEHEYLLPILALALRERDPINLLDWFRTLERVLGSDILFEAGNLSSNISTAIFESFSPFFPISIRPSLTSGPEATEDELKEALRSCFAANGQLAQHTFVFLLQKLDEGGTLTLSTKLDILRTIRACVMKYEPVDTCLVPFVPKMWSTLKHEVVNGEIPEAVEETLLIFEFLPSRLTKSKAPKPVLIEFLDRVWKECAEDLEIPTYTKQTGSILVSVARGNVSSFCYSCPKILDAIYRNLGQPKASAHTRNLLVILNDLVRTHLHLTSKFEDSSCGRLPDVAFGTPVSIIHGVYLKLLRDNIVENPSKEQVGVVKEALQGLSLSVQLQRVNPDGNLTAYFENDTLSDICMALSSRATNCFSIPQGTSHELKEIDKEVVKTLRTTIRFFPEGFSKILSCLLSEIKKKNWTEQTAERTYNDLHTLCQRVAFVGCTEIPVCLTPIVNFAAFAGMMLNILKLLFDNQDSIKACAIVADALATGMEYFVQTCERNASKSGCELHDSWSLESVKLLIQAELPGFPHPAQWQVRQHDPCLFIRSIKAVEHGAFTSFCLIGTHIVSGLYQHATEMVPCGDGLRLRLSESLRPLKSSCASQSGAAAYTGEISRIARVVLRELRPSAQRHLDLNDQIIACFQSRREMAPVGEDNLWHEDQEVFSLSCGVAQAIRPELVSTMTHTSLSKYLVGTIDNSNCSPQVQDLQDYIAFLVANKFDTQEKTCEGGAENGASETWKHILRSIEHGLSEPNSLNSNSVSRFVAILAGSFARRDRHIMPSITAAVSHAAAKGGKDKGPVVARISANLFFSSKARQLCLADHTVYKPLYLQWTYQQCVHPILGLAYPLSQHHRGDRGDAIRYAIYTLHAIKSLGFEHYAADACQIIRIVLAAMQMAEDNYDIEAACSIVVQILNSNGEGAPGLFRAHISSLVCAAKRVYGRTSPAASRPPSSEGLWPAAARPLDDSGASERFNYMGDKLKIRKMSLRILQMLPSQFEEAVVLAHANEVRVHLSQALGDRVREVRRAAEAAQAAWLQISN